MTHAVCPQCEAGWELGESDSYCGFCRSSLFDFSLEGPLAPIYRDRVEPIDQVVSVINKGLRKLRFQAPYVTPASAIELVQEAFSLAPGSHQDIRLKIMPRNLDTTQGVLKLSALNGDDRAVLSKTWEIRALEKPVFGLKPIQSAGGLPIAYFSKEEPTARLRFQLVVAKSAFVLEDVKCRPAGLRVVETGFPKGIFCETGKQGPILEFTLDCRRLEPEIPIEVRFGFGLRGRNKRMVPKLEILPRLKPELAISHPSRVEVLEGRQETVPIEIRNAGGSDLEIYDITTDESEDLLTVINVFPLRILMGEKKEVGLNICGRLKQGQASFSVRIEINSNCGSYSNRKLSLQVLVRTFSEHRNYLAIDFGTTNSCVAYLDKVGRPKLIPLEDVYLDGTLLDDPEIMQSLIVYHKEIYKDKKPSNPYSIGLEADTYRTSIIDGPFFVYSVKRWLGYSWERKFPRGNHQPTDVVRDMLSFLIAKSEEFLKEKVTRCVFSHPTMFSPGQKTALRNAIEACGFKVDDYLLVDEASAAAFGATLERNNTPSSNPYHFLVYDFGGGTIDMVMAKVEVSAEGQKIEPVSWGGDPKFGGDNVTQMIVEMMLESCRTHILKHASQKYLEFSIPIHKSSYDQVFINDQDHDYAMMRNTQKIHEEAEKIKKKLSLKNNEVASSRLDSIEISIEGQVNTMLDVAEVSLEFELSRGKLNELVRPKIKETMLKADDMILEAGGVTLASVILAGQSSRMPVVKETIKDHFAPLSVPPDVILLKSPKESVAIGACLIGKGESGIADEDIDIVGLTHKTHFRYGIEGVAKSGESYFREIVPKGKLIPHESWGEISFRARSLTNINVYEHGGVGNQIDPDYMVGFFQVRIPREDTGNAKLRLSILDHGVVDLRVRVNGREYQAEIQRETPFGT